MRKSQNFVVEYKSSRRREEPKTNSIWGSIDLKSFANEDVSHQPEKLAGGDDSHRRSARTIKLNDQSTLTLAVARSMPASRQLEDTVGDKRRTIATPLEATDTAKQASEATESHGTPAGNAAPVKAEAGTTEQVAAISPVSRQKQVRSGNAKSGTMGGAKGVKPVRRARVAKVSTPSSGAAFADTDGKAELAHLEQENQRLRKLLAEKLRGENADLRKRLGFK